MEYNSFKLGDICRIELGKTPSRSNKKLWDENKSSNNIWLSIADLPISIKPVMTDSKEYITDEGAELCKIVPENTLIVSFKLSLGRLAITGCDLYTNEAIAALYINENIELEQDYLYWYLTFFDWDAAAGSDIKVKGKTLNKAKLKEIIVAIPSLQEQKRIVALLDTVFADLEQTRAKTEQNLKNARELFESTCSISIFSTDEIPSCTVLDVAKNEKGAMRTGPFGSQLLKREIVDSGIAVLGIDNAVKNSFQWGAKRFITPEKFEELSRFEVKPGDVLITIMGTCGRCAIVPENIPKAINTKHICCITLDREKCLPEYLHAYFLYHPLAQEYLLSRAKGAIMAGLNMGIIKELPLVLPCIEEQKRLISQVNLLKDNIDKLVMSYEAKLVAIDELKKSILQKAFSGELTHD